MRTRWKLVIWAVLGVVTHKTAADFDNYGAYQP